MFFINLFTLARTELLAKIQKYSKQSELNNFNVISQQKLNVRQQKLLKFLSQDLNSRTNLSAYKSLYAVKKGAAIADLKELVGAGLLIKKKVGRNTFYYPTKEVINLFHAARS